MAEFNKYKHIDTYDFTRYEIDLLNEDAISNGRGPLRATSADF